MDHLPPSVKEPQKQPPSPAEQIQTATPAAAPQVLAPPPFAVTASGHDGQEAAEEESMQKDSDGGDIGGGRLGNVQKQMESAFNADFANVYVHENSQEATEMGALAFTKGNDVHFAPGMFQPNTQTGKELIGHELAHVVQQRENRVAPTTQTQTGMPVNDDKGLEGEADLMGAKAARGENTGMNGGASKAPTNGAQLKAAPALTPATVTPANDTIQQKSEEEEGATVQKKSNPASREMGDPTPPADNNSNKNQSSSFGSITQQKSANGSKGVIQHDKGDGASNGHQGIVPPIILNGIQLFIDVSHVEESTSVPLHTTILPGLVAKSIEVIIEEGVFVSGTLVMELNYLSGIDMNLTINADGTVNADISFEHEFLGFPTAANAQVTEEGITGNVEVQIPPGHQIVPGLKTTGGNIYLNFEEAEAILKGNVNVATDDGLASGSAQVNVDLQSGNWSGSAEMVGLANNINIAPGVDIQLPEGFSFSATFGGEEGMTVEGAATVVPQVVLQSADGMEAGGTAELDVTLGGTGLEFILHKVRLAVTGGLNAPPMEEVLEGEHLTSTVDAGGILTLWFEDSSLNKIDLEVTGGIDSSTRRIGRLSFAGQAEINPFKFIGMLHAITNASFALTEGEHFSMSVLPGSQLFVSLDNAGISNVDASLGLEVADQESALGMLKIASSLPRGGGLSLAAKIDLLKRLNLSTVEENGIGVVILPAAGIGATLQDGSLTQIQGALPFEVADQEGDLLAGNLEGQIGFADKATLENGTASASLLRELSMDLAAGEVKVMEGANLQVTFEAGKLVSLAGEVEAVYHDGTRAISISASVDYDPSAKILRSLDATLSTDEVFSLFDGKLEVSELAGNITIRNNNVVSLGGHARLDAHVGDFTAAGEADLTWSKNGEETSFVGAGWLQFSWYEDDEESDRYLNGRIDATIDGQNFSLLGSVEMGLMQGLTGQATLSMDQEMDPVISASLTYTTTVMDASELWAMEFGLGIQIPIIPVLITLEAGVLFGMSINTRPLDVFGTVGVENWRPKSSEIPDFYAELGATWGLDIEAKAMAYLELILGIDGVLALTGGVRAGVGLSIPIELAPHISLHGGQDGIWGEMGINLSIAPILKLLVDAYLEWDVLGIWDGEKIWNLVDQELAELGNIDWEGSFAFGDKQEPTSEPEAVAPQLAEPVGAPIATPEDLNADSSLGYGNNEQEPDSPVGLSGLTEGLETPSPEAQESEMDQGGLGEQFKKVGEYGDGIAAVGDLIGIIADGFKAFMKGGPVGLLIWMIFKKPSKSEINAKKAKVAEFRQGLEGDSIISPGSLLNRFLGILSNEYSWWVIFDGSKPYRDMVDRGDHEDANLEDRSKIMDGMIKGWTGEKDETRIITILEYTLANEGGTGVRELAEYVGGPNKIRDQYESFLGQDSHDRADLDRIFTIAYGSNWSNASAEGRPTYTAKEGATVTRNGRTFEDLALEAYGHESYGIYLRNAPFNLAENAKEEAYLEHQNNNQNNNGGWNGFPDPDDDSWDPHQNGNTNSNPGPPRPGFIAYILTMGEIVDLHAASVWQERFPVPGVLGHAHWFENYNMIAQFAYDDADYDDALKAHNLEVREIVEGSTVNLPSPEELGPPWIEVAPVAIGSTGLTVRVSPDSSRDPEMWMGSPDRLVRELAEEALQLEETKSAAEQLKKAATFTNDSSQLDAENAVEVAKNLIDFILTVSSADTGMGGTAWADASIGDTITLAPDQIRAAAEKVYGHAERAAWIIVFNENNGGPQEPTQAHEHSAKSSAMPLVAMYTGKASGSTSTSTGSGGNGPKPMKLPTWAEMNALDPLPTTNRGVAPKSTIEGMDGDTWSTLAMKAYGDWDLAVKLAEFSDNADLVLEAGTIVSIPNRGELNSIAVAAGHTVAGPLTTDGPTDTGTTTGTNTGPTSVTPAALDSKGAVLNDGTTDSSVPEVDNREFTPGSNLIVKAGDTWSALAVATYNDFSLFVKLSNHPLNVPFKTLPDGVEIYLPTLAELEDVPEFGLGLSPTGNPLLTEMVRVPTQDELHHVWVEDRSPAGEEPDGVWMMASTPFMLEPASGIWVNTTQNDDAVHAHAQEINRVAKEGGESKDEIQDLPDRLRRIVEGDYLEGNNVAGNSDTVYVVSATAPETSAGTATQVGSPGKTTEVGSQPVGITMKDAETCDDIFLENGTLLKILEEDTDGGCKVQLEDSCEIGFISLDDRVNNLAMLIELDEVVVGAIQNPIDISSGTFGLASAEAELLVEKSGAGGVQVPVKVGNFASGEMQIMRNEGGFQSVNDESIFMPVETGIVGDLFGSNFEVGIQARVANDGVIGEAVCKIGGEIVTTSNLSDIFGALNIPGIEMGTDFANASFVNGFYEDDFRIEFLNIPIVTGNQFSGTLDIGLVNGVPEIKGKAIVQVTPSITGVIELAYGAGGMTGEGTIQFIQGPMSGELNISVAENSIQASGEANVATEGFNGTAFIVYGNEGFVNEKIDPQLDILSQGGEVQSPSEEYEMEDGSGDYVLAGYVTGTIPIGKNFDATATGIIDSTGGLTLGVKIDNSNEIPLTDEFSDNYELNYIVPGIVWGIPQLGALSIDLEFFFGLDYTVGALKLLEAFASGVYSDSTYANAPEDSLSIGGKVGFNTDLTVGGGLSVNARAQLLGNEASVGIGGRINAMLSASAELMAQMDLTPGPEGIDPNFRAEAGVEGNLDLGLQGFFKANFDSYGEWLDAEYIHYFANLIFPVGTMGLNVVYDPSLDPAIAFETPDGGMFQINSWEEMLKQMHSADDVGEGNAQTFEAPEGESEVPDDGPLTEAREDDILGVQAPYQNDLGEIHTLKFEDQGDGVEIWRHSVPMSLEDYCDDLIKTHEAAGNSAEVSELQGIKTYLATEEWAEAMKNSMGKGELRKLAFTEIKEIADQLRELDDAMGPIPDNPVRPGVVGGGRPTKSMIDQLHQSQGNQGRPASSFPVNSNATFNTDAMSTAWKWLTANGKNGSWIKFHIINEHLGGLANSQNLIATTTGNNSEYERDFESEMKRNYRDGKVVWMEADIDYYNASMFDWGSIPNDTKQAFPKMFKARGGTMTYKNGSWTRVNSIQEKKMPLHLPSLPATGDKFQVNHTGAYGNDNLMKYDIWRSTGRLLKPYIDAGGSFVKDFFQYKSQIFGNNSFNHAAWPDFDLDDLPNISGGLLTFIKNANEKSEITRKRTIKQFMHLMDENNIQF